MANDKLTNYVSVDEPRVVKRRPVSHPYERGKTVGYIVYCYGRESPAYLSKRSKEKNLFHKYDSYPITDKVLGNFQGTDLDVVYIAEEETKNIYEYDLRQYLDAPVYEWDVEQNGKVVRTDRQRCPSRGEAKHVWEDHASDLFHSPT